MKKHLKVIISDPIFKQGSLIFASSILVNIFNLVFWLYMVRKLVPEDYGALNTLISVFIFFSMPTLILQTVIMRFVSKYMAQGSEEHIRVFLAYFLKKIAYFLFGMIVVIICFGQPMAHFLQIEGKGVFYLIAVGILFSSLGSIALGALSGLQKFNEVAINSVSMGIAKLVVGFFLVAIGFRVFGALAGFVISYVVGLGVSIFQLPPWLKKFKGHIDHGILDTKEIASYFLPVGLCTFSFYALTNMDVVLVKHFFSPLQAGYYSVAQMVGKIVLFIPTAVGVVMFPKVVDSHVKNGNTKIILKKCLGAVGFLCGVATVGTFLFPIFILKLLTGHSHPEAVALVKYFSLCMGFFALVNIFMLYHLSLHRMGYVYALAVLTVCQFLGICFFHQSLKDVLLILLVFSVALFCLGIHFSRKELTYEKP
jgi:O-antigen/teichoic acid export membrane protein